jgi:hypothetical protein
MFKERITNIQLNYTSVFHGEVPFLNSLYASAMKRFKKFSITRLACLLTELLLLYLKINKELRVKILPEKMHNTIV